MSSIKRSKKIAANQLSKNGQKNKRDSETDEFDSYEQSDTQESDSESESFEEEEFELSKRRSKRIRKRKPKINPKRRRKRESHTESESDQSDQSDSENNNKPKRKRRKLNQVVKKKKKKRKKTKKKKKKIKKKIKKRIKAKTIKAPKVYKLSEVQDLKVKNLKDLLRGHGFPVSGKKEKLIQRLLNPKKTIKEMKLSYHKMTRNRYSVIYSQEEWANQRNLINASIEKGLKFRESDYVFIDGKIKRNPLLWEIDELPSLGRNAVLTEQLYGSFYTLKSNWD